MFDCQQTCYPIISWLHDLTPSQSPPPSSPSSQCHPHLAADSFRINSRHPKLPVSRNNERSIYKFTALSFVLAFTTSPVRTLTHWVIRGGCWGNTFRRVLVSFILPRRPRSVNPAWTLIYTLWVISENWVIVGQESTTLLFFESVGGREEEMGKGRGCRGVKSLSNISSSFHLSCFLSAALRVK